MADSNSHATGAISKSDVEEVFNLWDKERDQLLALIDSAVTLIEPDGDRDSPCHTAWRIAEVARDMLNCTREFNHLKRNLLGEPA